MISEILRLIRQSKDGINPVEICKQLNISRSTLNQAVTRLVNEGYDIENVEGKGLVMYSYPEVVTSHEIMSRLETKWAGRPTICRKESESTNDEALFMAEEGRENGTLVVAEYQSGGKGRRGRAWISPAGSSIAMSIILKPDISPEKAPMITPIMALAVADVIQKLTDLDVKIKWPNDVLINKKKVCGILTEMSAKPGKVDYIVVGTGINVNINELPEDISGMATSMMIESGNRFGRADIVIAVMDYFEYYYDIFLNTGDLSALVDVYDSYLINKGKTVKVLDPKGEYTGTAEGINDFGELIVQREDGTYTRVDSGEVSVRGVYGYV